jgi:uncharacterized membrane protein
MSENEKEKAKVVIRLVNDYESLIHFWSEGAETSRRRIDLVRGVALGLIYGIIGNFFVQFFYPVVEALSLQEYPKSFWGNVIISTFSLAIILYTTIKFRSQLKEDERKMKLAIESIKREKSAVEELKKTLKEKSEEE